MATSLLQEYDNPSRVVSQVYNIKRTKTEKEFLIQSFLCELCGVLFFMLVFTFFFEEFFVFFSRHEVFKIGVAGGFYLYHPG